MASKLKDYYEGKYDPKLQVNCDRDGVVLNAQVVRSKLEEDRATQKAARRRYQD